MKTRYILMYLLFALAFVPSFPYIYDIIHLRAPKKIRLPTDFLMVSPAILVFDRHTYFAVLNFDVTRADLSTERIVAGPRFYQALWPYTVGAYVSRTLARTNNPTEVLHMLDQLFCKNKIPALGLPTDIKSVIFSIQFVPTNTTSEPFEVACSTL